MSTVRSADPEGSAGHADTAARPKRQIPGLRSDEEEARLLGVSERTLRRWRRSGYGPRVTQIGRFFYTSPAAHDEFIASKERPVELPAPKSPLRRRA